MPTPRQSLGSGTGVQVTHFVQHDWENTAQWSTVLSVANELQTHLSTSDAQRLLTEANRPGGSSSLVQASFGTFAAELGFRSEAKGLFSAYSNTGLRPDYYLPMEEDTGILMEVERGKTTINNMDMLDFWKCHMCDHANYLFLLVPTALVQNPTMRPKAEYAYVLRRMASFFVPQNYTNVRGLVVFGY